MSDAPFPPVSLVTPTYGMGGHLTDAIESVLAQDYPNLQYIVIDGQSGDGTLEILRGYGDRIQWCSEPDEGAADALRKGFAAAEGEILGWLNADDVLEPWAVREAVAALQQFPGAAAVYGGGHWIDSCGKPLRPYPVQTFDRGRLARECFICQPACFFRRTAYEQAGGIRPGWQTVFDWDLWIRLSQFGDFHHVPACWARVTMHGRTKTLGQRHVVLREAAALLAHHFGYVPFDWVYARHCFLQDGRDQFFEELRPSVRAWLRSLPTGLRANPGRRGRYFREWLSCANPPAMLRQVRRMLFPRRSG